MVLRSIAAGLLAGAGMFGWTILEYALGWHTTRADIGAYTGFVGIAFPIAAIMLAIRAERRDRGGAIAFGPAFAQGIGVALIFSLGAAIGIWLYLTTIHPGFLTSAAGAGQTAAGQALLVLLSSFGLGAVVALVCAALMRRRPLPAEEGKARQA